MVASASSRDKAKGKGTAASGPKHSALAAAGGASGAGAGMGRSKAGLDAAKRGEEAPSGMHFHSSVVTATQRLTSIKYDALTVIQY